MHAEQRTRSSRSQEVSLRPSGQPARNERNQSGSRRREKTSDVYVCVCVRRSPLDAQPEEDHFAEIQSHLFSSAVASSHLPFRSISSLSLSLSLCPFSCGRQQEEPNQLKESRTAACYLLKEEKLLPLLPTLSPFLSSFCFISLSLRALVSARPG